METVTHSDIVIEGHSYHVVRTAVTDAVVHYTLTDPQEANGWRLEYHPTQRRLKAHGIRPRRPSPEWLDRGEADVRLVTAILEPNAVLVELDAKVYRVGGPSWPLSEEEMFGLASGERMLQKTDGRVSLLAYVAEQRHQFDTQEADHPKWSEWINERRRFLDGCELAIEIGTGDEPVMDLAAYRLSALTRCALAVDEAIDTLTQWDGGSGADPADVLANLSEARDEIFLAASPSLVEQWRDREAKIRAHELVGSGSPLSDDEYEVIRDERDATFRKIYEEAGVSALPSFHEGVFASSPATSADAGMRAHLAVRHLNGTDAACPLTDRTRGHEL